MNDKTHFIKLLIKLAASKGVEMTDAQIAVYWEDLGRLRYSCKVLENARRNRYKTAMPTVIDLLEDHKLLQLKVDEVNTVDTVRYQLGSSSSKPTQSRLRAVFAWDLMFNNGYACDCVWEYLEKNHIDVPEDYMGIRKNKQVRDSYVNLLLENNLKNMRKINPKVSFLKGIVNEI